jgi:hypothetical protein
VCSGCSGAYAGGFEDSDGSANSEGDLHVESSRKRATESNWLSADEVGRLAGTNGRTCPHENRQWCNSAADSPDEIGQEWEVLVSAERIVEVRVVAASSCEIRELRGSEGSEMLAAAKHSKPESAKYYRTQGSRIRTSSNAVQTALHHRITGWLVQEFKRLVQWT